MCSNSFWKTMNSLGWVDKKIIVAGVRPPKCPCPPRCSRWSPLSSGRRRRAACTRRAARASCRSTSRHTDPKDPSTIRPPRRKATAARRTPGAASRQTACARRQARPPCPRCKAGSCIRPSGKQLAHAIGIRLQAGVHQRGEAVLIGGVDVIVGVRVH